jgi:hypothetical protein
VTVRSHFLQCSAPFDICVNTCGPRRVLNELCGYLGVEFGQPWPRCSKLYQRTVQENSVSESCRYLVFGKSKNIQNIVFWAPLLWTCYIYQSKKASHGAYIFFSGLLSKKTEEINQYTPLYRTWVGHLPELTALNPAHLEVCFLFPINRQAERTVSVSTHHSVEKCVYKYRLGVGSHQQQQRNQNWVTIWIYFGVRFHRIRVM